MYLRNIIFFQASNYQKKKKDILLSIPIYSLTASLEKGKSLIDSYATGHSIGIQTQPSDKVASTDQFSLVWMCHKKITKKSPSSSLGLAVVDTTVKIL